MISATSQLKAENSKIWIMPVVKLVPNSGAFGDEIEISGMGYGPLERIQVGMGRQHLLTEAYSSNEGTFSAKFNVSHNPKGENHLFAIGHGTYLLAEEAFFVREKLFLAPKEGIVGCGINLCGRGFLPGDEIKIDFGKIETISTCIVTRDGDFDVNFLCPKLSGGRQIIKVKARDFVETLPFSIKGRLVSLPPDKGCVGERINIELDGLIPNETLTIGFDNKYATYTINEDGTFSSAFIVETMPGGNKVITITTDSGIFHTQIFQIRPSISFVTPTTPLTGEKIVFEGVGFLAFEKIRVDFGRHEAILWTNADSNGSFIAEYTIADPPGSYRLVAIGYTTYQVGKAEINVIEVKEEQKPEEGERPKEEKPTKSEE